MYITLIFITLCVFAENIFFLKKIFKQLNQFLQILLFYFASTKYCLNNIIKVAVIIGPKSLPICLLTACCISMIFSLQIVSQFLYLGLNNIVGSVLSITFIRELSPVLTAVIVTARISSSFTSEIATMKITDQIDALYMLNIDPVLYIVFPRVTAAVITLPILNSISFATSLASSMFICFTIYHISPVIFFNSVYNTWSLLEFSKSLFKSSVFGFMLSMISCIYGLNTIGGSKSVGYSTTSSVVISLLTIFFLDFALSYLMYSQISSIINYL